MTTRRRPRVRPVGSTGRHAGNDGQAGRRNRRQNPLTGHLAVTVYVWAASGSIGACMGFAMRNVLKQLVG